MDSEIVCANFYIGMTVIFQNNNELIETVDTDNKQRQPPQSFSLENIHKHLLDWKPSMSHGTEGNSSKCKFFEVINVLLFYYKMQ